MRGTRMPTGKLLRSMLVVVLGVLDELRPIELRPAIGCGCSCFSGVLNICASKPLLDITATHEPCSLLLPSASHCGTHCNISAITW